MPELEVLSQIAEHVVFENSLPQRMGEGENGQVIQKIMDIPGTAHEKLIKLAEMI